MGYLSTSSPLLKYGRGKEMTKVFVLDTNKQPLDAVHPGQARLLLKRGRAAVWRNFPFTIILNSAAACPQVEPLRVKLDPGSKSTGIAILNDASGEVVFAAELRHRGHKIADAVARRRTIPAITPPAQNPIQEASFRQSEKQAAGRSRTWIALASHGASRNKADAALGSRQATRYALLSLLGRRREPIQDAW
jgi:hypothetical protein